MDFFVPMYFDNFGHVEYGYEFKKRVYKILASYFDEPVDSVQNFIAKYIEDYRNEYNDDLEAFRDAVMEYIEHDF